MKIKTYLKPPVMSNAPCWSGKVWKKICHFNRNSEGFNLEPRDFNEDFHQQKTHPESRPFKARGSYLDLLVNCLVLGKSVNIYSPNWWWRFNGDESHGRK